ncbi:MAG TPA: GIY-YIG nuclease family protein [Lutibacter sp.]|nr:GIY-YIG nuclease family protein [Lutibacter sp.]
MKDKKIGNSIFKFEREAGIDSPFGDWRSRIRDKHKKAFTDNNGIKEDRKETVIRQVNDEGTALMQIDHQFINIGESIVQVKNNTAVQVTKHGTIKIVQFKQEIASRENAVYYYKNSTGTFEGTIADAQIAFPNLDLNDLNIQEIRYEQHPEYGRIPILPNLKPIQWTTQNEFDAEKDNNGKPVSWDKWADATQTALDAIGLIPGIGEFADLANGVISLARGDYVDAALSFTAMIPFFGAGATIAKQANRIKKNRQKVEGVYDLIVKNGDDINGYVGQSNDMFKRIKKHFLSKKGKLKHTTLENPPIFHQMKGSTKFEREMYEQFVILEKYSGNLTKRGVNIAGKNRTGIGKLFNKVNPVGGRFDLENPRDLNEFRKKALEIAKKYELQTTFNPINF